MWCLLLLLGFPVALADDGGTDAPAPAEPAPADPAPAAPAPTAEPAPAAPAPVRVAPEEGAVGGEVIEVWDSRIARAREALNLKLHDEGYRKGVHRDDRTIFRSYMPWKPRVIVHDDGWVYLQREPPRVHSPGKSFSDQGAPAAYLWCILAPTACVSIGGWMIGPRKYQALEGEILDATHAEVNALNEAVARRALAQRINSDIPGDLERLWALDLPAAERRALVFELWDSRNENEAGEAARDAVEAFVRGVIMQSDEPYSVAEIAEYNGRRHVRREFLAAPSGD